MVAVAIPFPRTASRKRKAQDEYNKQQQQLAHTRNQPRIKRKQLVTTKLLAYKYGIFIIYE